MAIYTISFSPTGGTRKVAEAITGPWEGVVETLDLTDPNAAAEDTRFSCCPEEGLRRIEAERIVFIRRSRVYLDHKIV